MSSKNPFINHCLTKHPMVSAATASMMEIAWDDAINAVISVVQLSKGRKISLTGLKKLLSTKQRDAAPERPTTSMTIAEIDEKLRIAEITYLCEILMPTGNNRIPAIQYLRQTVRCCLKSAHDYVANLVDTGKYKLLGQDESDVIHVENYGKVKKLLTPAQENEVSEIWQLTGKVHAVKKVREITGCSLFEAVCYMRYATGEKR
jgi:ribosomal protein L7/L12